MGLYEPIVVLAVIVGIYATGLLLRPPVKRQLIWWMVAFSMFFGAVGIASVLLRGRTISFPSSDY